MAEPHVMDALREKRSELSGIVSHLEQQMVQHRASLVHLDAAMRLTAAWAARATSATRAALGRKVRWRTPTDGCGATCPATRPRSGCRPAAYETCARVA